MPEFIRSIDRKARKDHICELCSGKINKSEVYSAQTNKYDGIVYEFKAHKKCVYIMSALWSYIDPGDEGVDAETFQDFVADYCYNYVCPHCDKNSKETHECQDDKSGTDCIDKIYERLQKYRLKRTKSAWGHSFEEVENEANES